MSTMAYSETVYESYNVSKEYYLTKFANDYSLDVQLAVDTRPTIGNGGTVVSIRKSNGTVIASKLFPYYTDVSALTSILPSGEIRRVYVKPYTTGETIKGVLALTISY